MFNLASKSLLLICLTLFVSACGDMNTHSMSKICEDKPELCEDLHQIADCRFIRTSVIRARYQHAIDTNESNTRLLLEELDTYKACLELTLQIAYTRYKDRKRKRLENYLKSKELIDGLLKQSVGTTDPNLAYYLWTNYQDLHAKQVFLGAASQPNLADPYLLSKLAVYHSSDDPQRSLNFYYTAFAKSPNLESLPNGIFIQIISLLFKHHLYKEAYLWSVIATQSYQNSAPINLEMIVERGYISEQEQESLSELADQYIESLEQGAFKQQPPTLNGHNNLVPSTVK